MKDPVKRLRNEWVNFQNVKYLTAQVEKNPSDEAEKKRLADAEKKMPGMDDRVNTANSEIRKMEDEIFQTNQPKPHKFTIQLQRTRRHANHVKDIIGDRSIRPRRQRIAGWSWRPLSRKTQR